MIHATSPKLRPYPLAFQLLLCSILILSISPQKLKGQIGLPIYTQYLLDNYYTIIPAVAGTSPCTKIRLGHRYQWTGLEDSPAISSISYQGKLTQNLGIGVLAFHDVNGFTKQSGGQLSISYSAFLIERYLYTHQLSFGLSYTAINHRVDQRSFIQQNGTVPVLDPLVGYRVQEQYVSDFNISMSYIYRNFYIGLNTSGILSNLTTSESVTNSQTGLAALNYLGTLGYIHLLSNKVALEYLTLGSALATGHKTLEFSTKAYVNPNSVFEYYGGLGVRTIDSQGTFEINSLVSTLGFNYKNFIFGYSFDFNLSSIRSYNFGSHQITLGYNIFCKKVRKKGFCGCPAP